MRYFVDDDYLTTMGVRRGRRAMVWLICRTDVGLPRRGFGVEMVHFQIL